MTNENEFENIDSTNDELEEEVIEEEVVEEETTEEEDNNEVEELKKQVATLSKQKEHWKNKASKPSSKNVETTEEASDLSTKDLYALINAQVPQDDVEEVVKASKLLGKSIPEALQDETVKVILKNRAEYRATAQASNTTNKRASQKKVSDAEIVKKASQGEIPEKGSEEAERLYWAKRGGKR